MIDLPYLSDVCRSTPTKIVFLVVDGLGGTAHPDTGKSELETANLPNLDRLAGISACGLTTPVAAGITPGSGPGHMALFGYDPVKYLMGRGVLEALGIGVELGEGDVAARGNFCTIDADGLLVDRRAGRIPTAESAPLVELLGRVEVEDAALKVYPVQDYRFRFGDERRGAARWDTRDGSAGGRRGAAGGCAFGCRVGQGGEGGDGVHGGGAQGAFGAASREYGAAEGVLATACSA